MAKKPFIPVLLGTGRQGRTSEAIAKFIVNELNSSGFESILVDPVKHLASSVTSRAGKEFVKISKWQQIMLRAQGLLILTPEYNHGYPGELKLMLDHLFDEYKGKPVAVAGVSSGAWGGVRVVENLLPVLIALGLKPLQKALYFPNSAEFDPKEHKENFQKTLTALKEAL